MEIEQAGAICSAECLVHLFIAAILRKSTNYSLIMNLLLACCMIGFLAVACSSPVHRGTIHYTPISILVASQLFGKRQAFYWLIASLVSMTLFYVVVHGTGLQPSEVIKLSLFLTVPTCIFFCCYQAEVHYDKKTSNLISFSRELQSKAQDLQVLATTDSLTNLSNRYQFQNRLNELVERASGRAPFALFLVDMDGFKDINDTMGHSVGDEVLVEIGARLAGHCGKTINLARLGGDEFCIIQEGVATSNEAGAKALELHDVLTAKYTVGENQFSLGASVGFALCPLQTDCPKRLLAYADTAMYHAKHNQRAISCYSSDMTERLVENRILNEQLAVAIEKDEFSLVYQPQFDINSREVTGAEALLRWNNSGEMISPCKFIPLLEQSGRMIEVGNWILDKACQQQVLWREQGFDIRIAINVSAVQFDDPNFVQSVIDPIEKHNVSTDRIDLEITEGLLISDVSKVVAKLNRIRDLGIQISIDDFGTGYSSLAYLRQFPIDKLKIDRAFVKDIPDSDDGVIASSIIMLGQVLGMKVLAEGVETDDQLQYLAAHGCEEVQGFLFSMPESPDIILERYANKTVRTPDAGYCC